MGSSVPEDRGLSQEAVAALPFVHSEGDQHQTTSAHCPQEFAHTAHSSTTSPHYHQDQEKTSQRKLVWLVGAWEDSRGQWGGRGQGLNA